MQGETTSASVQTETTPQTKVHPHYHRTELFRHEPHQHQPRNVNEVQKAEQQGFNTRLAVWLTRNVGTMACAYLFAVIGIAGLIGAFTNNTSLVLIFGSISSYFLQLVLLPVILKRVGTMWAVYSFAVLAIVGLLAILNILPPVIALVVAWGSQPCALTFLRRQRYMRIALSIQNI